NSARIKWSRSMSWTVTGASSNGANISTWPISPKKWASHRTSPEQRNSAARNGRRGGRRMIPAAASPVDQLDRDDPNRDRLGSRGAAHPTTIIERQEWVEFRIIARNRTARHRVIDDGQRSHAPSHPLAADRFERDSCP